MSNDVDFEYQENLWEWDLGLRLHGLNLFPLVA